VWARTIKVGSTLSPSQPLEAGRPEKAFLRIRPTIGARTMEMQQPSPESCRMVSFHPAPPLVTPKSTQKRIPSTLNPANPMRASAFLLFSLLTKFYQKGGPELMPELNS
jgi:hypothetical protein